ncbi:putative sucrose phosphorylase [Prochlorococcus marinus str. SS51]|uniref:sugar phosphorylase n=1 Tax=Prochlorococcus marinus TaxID=1219 RepID=UPI00031F8161|nr:putative sucrose phosphorylase [Prochlorococcus marinus str. SS2]KGG23783.1 putative sucrose phosphorylase [Prochlorococcus marinus str. SS35]KGG32004.1 putative sucrose phosphorylase [Prochlorococcus marinus str. SS51]
MTGAEIQLDELSSLLKKIYTDKSVEEFDYMWSQLIQILEANSDNCFEGKQIHSCPWDSTTAVLITYADGVYSSNRSTLKTLGKLIENHLGEIAPIIHLLPFLCSTSDGGFAVSSYEKIDSRFGSWDDLKNLSDKHILMADLVLNHVSASHPWVQQFKNGTNPGKNYILSPSIKNNWENVIRPRNTSLFTNIATIEGNKDVWTTFGPDQIDVNWREPKLLLEFINLIVRYLNHGIKWIRLDAIGFIWKEPSTTCLHMEQVHNLVKVLRIILEKLKRSGVLITETNVPEKENISYLKSGSEAHLAYNFPLPPLLLESLINNKADLINNWLCSWPDLPVNTGFLNFTASHDGIGLRALEGLMDSRRIHNLLISCEKRGGLVSHRRMPNGEDKPYELNISWWSAMADTGVNTNYLQFERFILSQFFVMALKGVPAFYLQAIMASENDLVSFGQSGERRDLNRQRFDENTLENSLLDPKSFASKNLKALRNAMTVRSSLKAFHPEQAMHCLSGNRSDFVIIRRGMNDCCVWAVHNMTNKKLSFSLSDNLKTEIKNSYYWNDALNNQDYKHDYMELSPYSVHWLIKKNEN